LISFGGRVRLGLSGLQDNQIISNKLIHKQKQNCQKFDTKTQSQTQQTQAQTQSHFLSRSGEISPDPARSHQIRQDLTRFGEISLDPATTIQEITRSDEISPDPATIVEENNQIR
jgi:hypothetical protein